MEDPRSQQRNLNFIQIKFEDPVRKCEQFIVSLRKKKAAQRVQAKRKLLNSFPSQTDNCSNNHNPDNNYRENRIKKLLKILREDNYYDEGIPNEEDECTQELCSQIDTILDTILDMLTSQLYKDSHENWIPEIKLSSIDTDRLCLYFEMVMHISFEKFSGIDLMYAKTCDNELKFTKVVKELFTRLPYDIKYKLIYDNLFCGISNLLIDVCKDISERSLIYEVIDQINRMILQEVHLTTIVEMSRVLRNVSNINIKCTSVIPICLVIMKFNIPEISLDCVEALSNILTFSTMRSLPIYEIINISNQLKQVKKFDHFESNKISTQLMDKLNEYIEEKFEEIYNNHFETEEFT